MRLVQASVELLRPLDSTEGVRCLQFIESMARISHRSEDWQTDDTWRRFISSVVLDHGDWSVVEHATATSLFRVNRGVTHELVRHRLFSFTQESTRFVNGRKSYPDGLEFICPATLNQANTPNSWETWVTSCLHAEESYLEMLDDGLRPQEARSVLPNALAATIAVTGNLRNWRHLLLMRTSKETHPDFKQVTIPLLATFKERIPLLFADIEPENKQSENMRLPR